MSAVKTGAPVPFGPAVSTFLRSFAIQGSWNYRTMLGQGFAFALLPILRCVHAEEGGDLARAVERHAHHFNAHPYLADLALGAVARMELDGIDPVAIERFKDAMRGPLGSIGDRLVWAGGLPVAALLALLSLALGAPFWVPLAIFLVTYNAGHLALRVWAFRTGLNEGAAVAGRLSRAHLSTVADKLMTAGTFLVGCLVGFLALRLLAMDELRIQVMPVVGIGILVLGHLLGATAWRIATVVVVAGVVATFLLGLLG